MSTIRTTYDEPALAGKTIERDARALLGQVLGFVAVTVGFAALGAYLGRDLIGGAARRLTRMARVEFHKHDWLLSGFGHLICGDAKRPLTTNSALLGPRSRPCHAWVRPRASSIGAPARDAAIPWNARQHDADR